MRSQDDSCVVLSPHLDDAVLSVWHVLSSPLADVRVVTVFAGIPEAGTLTALDRAHGAVDSAELMRKRRADDRAALAAAGREPVHADLLDVQYRADHIEALRLAVERDPTSFVPLIAQEQAVRMDPAELRSRVEPLLEGADLVYAPAGIGGHPDHCDLAHLGLRLADEGRRVRIYGDMPYFVQMGLPSWFTHEESPSADAFVEAALTTWPAHAGRFDRRVVDLTLPVAREKIAAARLYETEFERGNAEFDGVLADPDAMRYEVYWTLAD